MSANFFECAEDAALEMSDEYMLKKVAEYWVILGGDSDGLRFCYSDLLMMIDQILGDDE